MNLKFKKFISSYRTHLPMLTADLLCAMFSGVISLIYPLITRYITKQLESSLSADITAMLWRCGALVLLLVLIQYACNFFTDYQGHAMGAKMESELREELFAHYQKLPICFYDRERVGHLMSRLTSDLSWLTELYHHGPEDFVLSIIKFFGSLLLLWHINWKLTLAVSLFLPLLIGYAVWRNSKMRRALKRNQERIADINAQAEDSLSGIRVVKSFCGETAQKLKFHRENTAFYHSRKYGYLEEAKYFTVTEGIVQLLTMSVMILGGFSIAGGTLDLPDLLAFSMYVGNLIDPINRLINFNQLYQEGIAGFERVWEMLQQQPEQDSPQASPWEHPVGEIQFQQVGFHYEDCRPVLENINFTVHAGEYVAFVGASGVRKTTLCSLIPRFYQVTEGTIFLDGKNLNDYTLSSLRSQIGVVQQDVYLFAGTVRDNICFGVPNASEQQIIQAAKQANAHSFILSLPQGYDTDVGPHGVKLSGGQKQRISLARAFLHNPAILILDEATSSLDNASELAVQQALEQLVHGRTTLVIAHRLSTIRNAQRIFVLDNGTIAESGTHAQLLAKNGVYARLYRTQLFGETSSN